MTLYLICASEIIGLANERVESLFNVAEICRKADITTTSPPPPAKYVS